MRILLDFFRETTIAQKPTSEVLVCVIAAKELATMSISRRVVRPIRTHIDLSQEKQMRFWSKHPSVSRDDLQRAIDKVGNSVAAVRRQLALARQTQLAAGQ